MAARLRRGRLPAPAIPATASLAVNTLTAASPILGRARGGSPAPGPNRTIISAINKSRNTQAPPHDHAALARIRATRCQGPSSSPSRRASGTADPATSSTLSRLVAPLIGVTSRRGTPNASATARRTARVDAPRAGARSRRRPGRHPGGRPSRSARHPAGRAPRPAPPGRRSACPLRGGLGGAGQLFQLLAGHVLPQLGHVEQGQQVWPDRRDGLPAQHHPAAAI